MRRPQRDPQVTDLRRYRRERERARGKPARTPNPEPLLGRRRHAGLILAVAIIVLGVVALTSGGVP